MLGGFGFCIDELAHGAAGAGKFLADVALQVEACLYALGVKAVDQRPTAALGVFRVDVAAQFGGGMCRTEVQVGGIDAAAGHAVLCIVHFAKADTLVRRYYAGGFFGKSLGSSVIFLQIAADLIVAHLHQLHAADLLGHRFAAADAHAAGEADATAFVVAVVVQVAGGEGGSAEAVAALGFGSGCGGDQPADKFAMPADVDAVAAVAGKDAALFADGGVVGIDFAAVVVGTA